MNPDDKSNLPQIPDPANDSLQSALSPPSAQNTSGQQDQVLMQSGQPMTQDMASVQARAGALPEEANDLDVIEKEWVIQLKNIVSHTAQDPYTQQAEITKIKADYMKKRYNKDIKVTGT